MSLTEPIEFGPENKSLFTPWLLDSLLPLPRLIDELLLDLEN